MSLMNDLALQQEELNWEEALDWLTVSAGKLDVDVRQHRVDGGLHGRDLGRAVEVPAHVLAVAEVGRVRGGGRSEADNDRGRDSQAQRDQGLGSPPVPHRAQC